MYACDMIQFLGEMPDYTYPDPWHQLEAVRVQQPGGPRLVAFFAVMYYAGLRPEEAINLRADDVVLAPLVWTSNPGTKQTRKTGELHLQHATPDAGSEWTDDRSQRERRQLKHRAQG